MPSQKRFSYSDQRKRRSRVQRGIMAFLGIFLAFVLLNGLFLSTYRVESSAMEPAFRRGDFLLASPLVYGPRTAFSTSKLPGFSKPHRGDLVMAEPPAALSYSFFSSLADSFVRFVTFQRIGLRPAESQPVLKRVVGVPGDRLSISGGVVRIKVPGLPGTMTEYELVKVPYQTKNATLPKGWTDDLPFSGSAAEMELGQDQYYLLNDDRSATGDSRSWGPVSGKRILAKVLLRYWPFGARR